MCRSAKEKEERVPDAVKGFAKDYASTYQEDLLYNDEWDDSFDGQAPVRVAGDTTSDEVSNLSISGTYDAAEDEEIDFTEEDSNSRSSGDLKPRTSTSGKPSSKSSTHSYAQKRNRKKLAAKKRAV